MVSGVAPSGRSRGLSYFTHQGGAPTSGVNTGGSRGRRRICGSAREGGGRGDPRFGATPPHVDFAYSTHSGVQAARLCCSRLMCDLSVPLMWTLYMDSGARSQSSSTSSASAQSSEQCCACGAAHHGCSPCRVVRDWSRFMMILLWLCLGPAVLGGVIFISNRYPQCCRSQ